MNGHESSIRSGTNDTGGQGGADGRLGAGWPYLMAAGAAAIILAGLWTTATMPFATQSAAREANPQCAAMARVVAGRSHSMFDGQRYRATERRVYALCTADPAAFGRLVRGY